MAGEPRVDRLRGAPTQVDVARAAKVSTATVSRVLNNSPLVGRDAHERVLAAMRQLAYFPHGAARALALNRSHTIGAVVPTLDNDIFARGINALMARLREAGYSLVVSSSDYSLDAEATLIKRLLERGVDGLFLVGALRNPDAEEILARSGRPYVCSYVAGTAGTAPMIGFENAKAAAAVIDHLVGLGHRRIAMFAGETAENDRAKARLDGARRRLAEHGLALDEAATCELPYSITAGREAFRELLVTGELPDAILCGNDILAMGVLFEAAEQGVAIPADLSLVGFDNHPLTAHVRPSLTTVEIRADRMAAIAADALVAAIEDGGAIPSTVIDAPLLVRDTTAPPRIAGSC